MANFPSGLCGAKVREDNEKTKRERHREKGTEEKAARVDRRGGDKRDGVKETHRDREI